MRRKTSPRPLSRATAVRPLVSATSPGLGRLPTAAALAAALFAAGAIGCGARGVDGDGSIHADEHARVVIASSEPSAVGSAKLGMGTVIDAPPDSTTMATTTKIAPAPHPPPMGGKVAIVTVPTTPRPAGGPAIAPAPIPHRLGGKPASPYPSPLSAPLTTTGATTGATTGSGQQTPPCPNAAADVTY